MTKKMENIVVTVSIMLAMAPCLQASLVTVFLDNGIAPGSSNTNTPYTGGSRDATWDISATAQNGLNDIGAAVMSVRMVTINMNGNSRGADIGGGNGLAVQTGSNNAWFDSGEGVVFQFAFYSDAGKTAELSGVNLTLNSLLSRVSTTNLLVHANAASKTLSYTGPLNNDSLIYLNGTAMQNANDATLADVRDLNLRSSANAGVQAADQWFTIAASGNMTFSANDTFWLRRANINGASDAFYQISGITFDVTAPTHISLVVILN